jgi:hypothetical protein
MNVVKKISGSHAQFDDDKASFIRSVRFAIQAIAPSASDVLTHNTGACTNAFIDDIVVKVATDHLKNAIYVVYTMGVILAFFNIMYVRAFFLSIYWPAGVVMFSDRITCLWGVYSLTTAIF